jgi:acyl-coenzyme A synthetase/AMP-(fatty) acid ligase
MCRSRATNDCVCRRVRRSLDVHVRGGRGGDRAFTFEGDDGSVSHFTYAEALERVCAGACERPV